MSGLEATIIFVYMIGMMFLATAAASAVNDLCGLGTIAFILVIIVMTFCPGYVIQQEKEQAVARCKKECDVEIQRLREELKKNGINIEEHDNRLYG